MQFSLNLQHHHAPRTVFRPLEARQIIAIDKEVVPEGKTFLLPQGLQKRGRTQWLSTSRSIHFWSY